MQTRRGGGEGDAESRAVGGQQPTHTRAAPRGILLSCVFFILTHPPTQSTLLKVLACSISGGEVRGAIYVNGAPVVAKEFRAASAVVWQRDILMSTATVREAIMTSAQLRLPQSMSRAEKRRRVDHIITELVSLERGRERREREGEKRTPLAQPQHTHSPLHPHPITLLLLRAWTTAAI